MSTINHLPAIATLAVAGAAGTLAAVATSQVAVETHAVSTPALGWLIPVIIEGGAVTAGLLAWRRTGLGMDARIERLALALLVGLAVVVNGTHAAMAGGALLGVILAACPPLVLVASAELLLRNRAVTEAAHERSAQAEQERSRAVERKRAASERRAQRAERAETETANSGSLRARADAQAPGEMRALTTRAGRGLTAERRAAIEHIESEEPGLSHTALGQRIGVGRDAARRYREQIAADERAA